MARKMSGGFNRTTPMRPKAKKAIKRKMTAGRVKRRPAKH
jgi:hypothetical protein